MCGIAGFVDSSAEGHQKQLIRQMLEKLAHRGPDGEGIWECGPLCLGHRRLAIIDLSKAGDQPMHYRHLTVIFNGELYNYIEIREELKSLGHSFNTGTDTEVLLHAYSEWGSDCLSRFSGMWAFALHDRLRNSLLLSRDRFGIKPLYFMVQPKLLLFASEIKALLPWISKRRVHMQTLLEYLVVGLEDTSDRTFYEGIKQLLPGHNALYDLSTHCLEIHRYYNLPNNPAVSTVDDFDRAFSRAIRIHLRSDVPVGTCLSGGLDSSTIAALSSPICNLDHSQQLTAITASAESSERDESHFAQKVALHCNLDWHNVRPTYDDFVEGIERCLYLHDEPVGSPSVFMQYYVMKKARELGMKVMLDGQGGDETLLGYERYYPAFLLALAQSGCGITLLREWWLASRHSILTNLSLLAYSLYFSLPTLRRHVLARRARFIKPALLDLALDVFKLGYGSPQSIYHLQSSEILQYQLPHLLRYEDRNSMAFSIESRVPFLDHLCVETALALTSTEKIRDGFTKHALRLIAARVLPKAIAWRRDKAGFDAPTKLWLLNHRPKVQSSINNSPLLRELCIHVPTLETISLSLAWRLYNVSLWESQHQLSI